MKTIDAAILSSIVAALNAANGKRRTRIASEADVLRVVERVAAGETGSALRVTLGCVPNSYSYKAPATTITSAKVGDVVRVRIACGNASKKAGGGADWVESAKNYDTERLLAEQAPEGTIEIPVEIASSLDTVRAAA